MTRRLEPSSDLELTEERGLMLPRLARETLEEALGRRGFAERGESRGDAWLFRPAATFVTLTQAPLPAPTGHEPQRIVEARLRGCVGTIRPARTLLDDLRHNSRAAALRDPRFPPLTADELDRDPVAIAVSVLSPLVGLDASSDDDLLTRLRPGTDGVVLQWGRLGGTYLPQVWRHFAEPADFLASLKAKAGLPPDFWAPDLRVWTFTVRSWSESQPSPPDGP